jgi:hypothetical protein
VAPDPSPGHPRPEPPGSPVTDSEPSAAAAQLAEARSRLLGGRGPGASASEIDRHTQWRTHLAGHPTSFQRAQVAEQTALARREPDALARNTTAATTRLATTTAELSRRITAHQPLRLCVVALVAAGTGAMAAMVVLTRARLRGH